MAMAMGMAMRKEAAVAVMMVMVVTLAAGADAGAGAACEPAQLAVCASAILGGTKPSGECCGNLRAQQGCLCQYVKDPNYGHYVSSPHARDTLNLCGIPVPHC
uniref:Probable non-specific lipid-transfer protein n=1 Tax=Hordeum vulgare TaxID=4513 RepID=NLTP2_HORVU|nr:RecName: Full=Probable non-specific lipid-transfer protein; Short=LTP; AltName: Full=Aleurone-specific 10 kDa protein; AltName: Full=B-FABP; Flags: Precursor [Hordeum vulgare]CAA33329.1 aleurone specific protein [Hordeum vulgare]CAA40542.1 putative phospholipid transfer protein [Hordeum vulgare subsp. vulgare]CAA49448.1 lipid transfer protein [Hordeum vulgare subsp. vulgare]prf//1807328A aleurone-specific protein [Hordeum vulgare]